MVIFLRMRQRSTKIFAHLDIYLDSITITKFDTDFVPGVATGEVAGRMRICQKKERTVEVDI